MCHLCRVKNPQITRVTQTLALYVARIAAGKNSRQVWKITGCLIALGPKWSVSWSSQFYLFFIFVQNIIQFSNVEQTFCFQSPSKIFFNQSSYFQNFMDTYRWLAAKQCNAKQSFIIVSSIKRTSRTLHKWHNKCQKNAMLLNGTVTRMYSILQNITWHKHILLLMMSQQLCEQWRQGYTFPAPHLSLFAAIHCRSRCLRQTYCVSSSTSSVGFEEPTIDGETSKQSNSLQMPGPAKP